LIDNILSSQYQSNQDLKQQHCDVTGILYTNLEDAKVALFTMLAGSIR